MPSPTPSVPSSPNDDVGCSSSTYDGSSVIIISVELGSMMGACVVACNGEKIRTVGATCCCGDDCAGKACCTTLPTLVFVLSTANDPNGDGVVVVTGWY